MKMNKILILLFGMILLTSIVSALIPQENKILARYDFEEGTGTIFSDFYGNANNGSISGSDYSWETGIIGNYSLHFGGTDNTNAVIPTNSLFSEMCQVGSGCTISFFANFTRSSTGYANISGDLLGNYNGGSVGWAITVDASAIEGSGGSPVAVIWIGDGNIDTYPNFFFEEGQLYHIVLSKDSDENVSLFINNVSQALAISNPITTNANSSEDIYLGASPYSWDMSNNMTIDELIFWNISLNEEEINTLYENYYPIEEEPPVEEPAPQVQGVVYQTIVESGAGLGIFMQLMSRALPVLLIMLALVAVIAGIGYGIAQVIKKGFR